MGRGLIRRAQSYIRRGNRKRLRFLLGKHPELYQSSDALLLDYAIWHNRSLVPWLLDRGAPVDGPPGNFGCTPLVNVVAAGDLPMVELLLQRGADPNAVTADSETPLGFAVAWRQAGAIAHLLAAGADPNRLGDHGPGCTHLDHALRMDWPEGAALLRAAGARRFAELERSLPPPPAGLG